MSKGQPDPTQTVTQNPTDITAPKAPFTVPPVATPPTTGTGLDAFVTGKGIGTEGKGSFTGKGPGK